MTFHAFGLNYESAPVQLSEAFALNAEAQRHIYRTLRLSAEAELVLLSTCNRTEAYLYGTLDDVARVREALSEHASHPWVADYAFHHEDEEAVRHVFHVASGLKSMVLGDAQILAQVKEAYRLAVEADRVDTVLHRMMHTAFRAAKRVANETDVASGAASVSTAAVAMAREHFTRAGVSGLQGCHVLLIGAGKMGQLALAALHGDAPSTITITNRSPERARLVAEKYNAEVVDWDDRHDALAASDFVIVATAASEPVIYAKALPPRDEDRNAVLVDISMPRNIEAAVGALSGYTAYDLDDLQRWTLKVKKQRGDELPAARAICEELLSDYITWVFHQQALQPAIQSIRDTFESIRQQEVDRHAHRVTGLDREEIDHLTRSIMQKLLAVPVVRLKNVDPDSIDFVRGIKLLDVLFSRPGCDDADNGESPSHISEYASEQPPLSNTSDVSAYCPFDPDRATDKDGDEATRLRNVLSTPSGAADNTDQ